MINVFEKNMKNFYVHIGMPKAGSTSIQQFLHTNLEVGYLGKFANDYAGQDLGYFFRHVAGLTPNYILPVDYWRRKFGMYLAENNHTGPYLVSDEILSGIGFASYNLGVNIYTGLDNLKSIFGDRLRIVSVLRYQLDLLKSYYLQLLMHGYPLSFQSFIKSALLTPETSVLHALDYSSWLQYCDKQEIDVILVDFDSMVMRPTLFAETLEKEGFIFLRNEALPKKNSTYPLGSYVNIQKYNLDNFPINGRLMDTYFDGVRENYFLSTFEISDDIRLSKEREKDMRKKSRNTYYNTKNDYEEVDSFLELDEALIEKLQSFMKKANRDNRINFERGD
jgi:hypothetical protein